MSTASDLLAALLARRGQEYFAEFQAFHNQLFLEHGQVIAAAEEQVVLAGEQVTLAAAQVTLAAQQVSLAEEQVDLAVLAVAEAQTARAGAEAARDEAAALVASIEGGPVVSVNGHTDVVVLTAADVGAVPTAALGDFADLEELAATVRLQV